MATKRELAAAEDAGFKELDGLLEKLTPAQMEEPGYYPEGWSAKDLMAHIGSWQAEAGMILQQIRNGTFRDMDVDVEECNRKFYEANADLPLSVIRAEYHAARTRMLSEWNALPAITPKAEEWFRESGEIHYQEHLPRLREWVEELRSRPTTARRVGVMGGTFDPIHHGHLVTAEEALWQFHLDEVIFVPTGFPWMKAEREVTSPEHRYLMTVIATSSNPQFSVSRIEVERRGPTYTVETLQELRRTAEEEIELFFITGADAMLEILHWKDPEGVLSKARFIAATRPGYDIARFEREAPTSDSRVSVMDVPALAISSTDIRRRVEEGEPIRYLVPEGVQTYIEKTGLYRGSR